jgi:UDP:flavonoid glycosyltransferase YjiC (YdhE family)/GrpB-like predicted nucleotidyltransferase (UPF0157 family)
LHPGAQRIFLGAFGDPGHAFPMLALGARLAASGYEVLFQTWRKWQLDVEAAGMTFTAAPEYQVFPTMERPLRPYEAAARAAAETVPVVEAFRPGACVSDILTIAPALAAEACGVRVATLVPHLHPDAALGHPPWSLGARLPRTALGAAFWRAALRPVRTGLERGRDDYNACRATLGLAPRSELHPGLSRELTMVATLPHLEYPREWPAWLRVVGPLMWEPPGEEIAPPPGDGPVVLVAPSTAQDPDHVLLRAALAGLASEPVRVIATWNGREPVPPISVPANAVLVPWLSYARTMPHCDVVVSHAGHGTVMRALTSGVPVVACPSAGDMAENAARLEWAGLGVRLPRRFVTPAGVRLAVARALATPRLHRRAAAVARWASEHDGAGAAIGEIERWLDTAPSRRQHRPMQLGTQQADVRVVPFDAAWAATFAAEAEQIRAALGDVLVRLDHVGSTSVAGLAAKPTIDMQGSVEIDPIPLAAIARTLAPLGYVHVPFPDTDDYPMFARPATGHRDFHLHFCVIRSGQERRHLAVRDFLRTHPDESAAYAAVKLDLADRHADDRPAYVAGKDAFVKALEQRALAWVTSLSEA